MEDAMRVWEDMQNKDVKPDAVSYNTLIYRFCGIGSAEDIYRHMEWEMEDALRLQAEMVGKRYEPDLESYGTFIDGYLKHGNETMAEVGPNDFSGCATAQVLISS
ncbi:Hypothetical predicted protein [Olea europaea subsp. europaea]|uniref:Pentatricopeptide repeat-containing protein n=1 Tax=Olea europaea subsp. europaea TaxID=158383 RepID=A0A8S0PMQ9_OLEEU|nr:Hypothetical predicted protein [Olea europaea subsp. europaea]